MIAYQEALDALHALRRAIRQCRASEAFKDFVLAEKLLDAACAEISYLECKYCEATNDDHDWVEQKQDITFDGDWEKCSRCGVSRLIQKPTKLEAVK